MLVPTPEQILHWKWLAHVEAIDVARFDHKWVRADRPDHMASMDGSCHLWIAGASRGGEDDGCDKLPYGSFWIAGHTVRAHIFAALVKGTWDGVRHVKGLHVDHRCRRTLCVAPLHLEPITPAINANRYRRRVGE